MPNFSFLDPGNVLGKGPMAMAPLSIARALTLLAIACAPAPGSRYQPGTGWAVIKYATAIEPRMRPSGSRQALANKGIEDLDPHQKTVLADELGVAFALARIDSLHGIDGLYDCYALHRAGMLDLYKEGRHRRMPDFLILLKKPLRSSKFIFLECKGSTRSNAASEQLGSACAQLDNVASAFGVPCRKDGVPRVGMALTARPGRPVQIEVSDPEEQIEFPPEIERKLRANYVALELAAFGDLAAADRVRRRHELPSFAALGVPPELLQRSPKLRLEQVAWGSLPASNRSKFKEMLAEPFIGGFCLARLQILAEPSKRAQLLQKNPELEILSTPLENEPTTSNMDTSENSVDGARLRFQDRDQTTAGSFATVSIDIWRAPA